MNSRRRIRDLLRWIREPIPDEDGWKRLRRCFGDRTKRPFAALLESFFLEHVPDGPILELRVLGSLGVGDALIFQPRIQFGEALYPWLGPEHLVAQIADLVLDLPFLPSRGRRAGHRLDQMMRAHLQKATIVSTRLADKDRLDRRLHVVVDAAPAHPAIELERLVVGVEHQLLGLTKVDPHKRHAAVRQLHVRRLIVSGNP
jgi:hypothetical protein